MLQFTEILPKSLGVHFNALLAPAIAPPLQALTRVMGPILWFIHLINLPFAGRKQSEDTTLEQISGLAAAARLSRVIDPHQARMIEAASELEDIKVRQIMTPRTEVQYLRVNQPIEETLGIIQSCPYTRLPLCEGSIDNIIGIVNVKDVMRGLDLAPGRFRIEQGEGNSGEREARSGPGSGKHVFGSGTIDLRRIQRDALALPENINILQALRRFQAERQHMAVVVDEYGATQGIVTLEDVLEEMVGDIEDEFDPSAPQRIRPEGDGYRVEGRVSLYELASRIPGLGIDHTEEQVDTAGGYVSQLMGRVPARGDRVISRGFSWTVTLADARQVHEVFLEPLPEPEEGEER
jgi:magnesium and cobalt transporter